jgi:hypothetical protein
MSDNSRPEVATGDSYQSGGFPQPPPPLMAPPSFPQGAPQYAPPSSAGGVASGSNGVAVAALVLGIIGILLGWIFIGLPFALGGIVCGVFGIKKSATVGKGKAMSIIGIVLSVLAFASAVLVGFGVKEVFDSLEVANKNDYSITTSSCSVSGGYFRAEGEITNKTTDSKTFSIGMSDGSFAESTIVKLAAGETKEWTILADSTPGAACSEPVVRNFFN